MARISPVLWALRVATTSNGNSCCIMLKFSYRVFSQQSISRLTGQWSEPITSIWMAALFTLGARESETQK